jgi:hypothetical protein
MSEIVKVTVLGDVWYKILDACNSEYPKDYSLKKENLIEFFRKNFNAKLFTYEHDIWGYYYIEFSCKEDFVLLMLEWS